MSELPDPDDLREALEPLWALPRARAQRHAGLRLLADYQRSHALGERALVVALVGATGAGKSTLLNALAGDTIAKEGVDRPTSREAVVYAPEGTEVAAPTGARVERYRTRAGAPWAGQVFIDTPDLNSVQIGHRDIARSVLETADVALLVLHKGSVAEAVQAEFLQEFAQRRRLVVVLNFADQLGAEARSSLLAQAKQLLADQWKLTPDGLSGFAISAKEAQTGNDASKGWAQLVRALQGLADSGVASAVRRSNAGAALDALRALLLPVLNDVKTAQEAVQALLLEGLGNAQRQLEADLVERMETGKGHLRDVARRLVSSRGWGPLALLLKTSSVGTGGLAAGTLLLRQSVPWGIALAGASAAVDALARKGRARHALAEMAGNEAADDGSVGVMVRAALGAARAEARRRDFEPEQLGVPEPELLCRSLAAARLESWRYTEQTALLGAIARWWSVGRWLLFPLVNLAFIALVAHVGYSVVRAYLEGQYLDTRYYLNAAALALLAMGVASGLVSLTLRGAVSRARRTGLAHFGARWSELRGELTAEADTLRTPWERALSLLRPLGPR